MPTSTSSDDVATAFARVYGTIVDQVEPVPDELPAMRLAPTVPRQPRRGPLVALATAVVVALAIGGVALLRQEAPVAAGPTVERIALLEPPAELGPVELVSAVATRVSDIAGGAPGGGVPAAEVWLWADGAGPSRSVALIETAPGTDLELFGIAIEGDVVSPPSDGEVAELLMNGGLIGRSWLDGESWRIAVGQDEQSVARLADEVRGSDPSATDIEGFDLAYGGPQSISSEVPHEMVDMQYRAADGIIQLSLLRGIPFANALIRLQMPDVQLALVNGAEAVVGAIEPDDVDPGPTLVAWQVDDHSSAFVVSDVLSPEAALSVAGAVEALSLAEWDELVAGVSPPSPVDSGLSAMSDQVVVASGANWEVRAQVFSTPETPDELGVCGWMTADGTGELYDMGCQGNGKDFDQVTPRQVRTVDGLVVTGGAPAEVVEIRVEATAPGDTVITLNHVIDPATPYGWWAVELPDGPAYTAVTFWDAGGNQLLGGGRLKADQVIETD